MNRVYHFNKYVFEFSESIRHDTFDERGYCHGINFYDGRNRYQVVSTCIGERLIINSLVTMGEYRDLPWNMSTAAFLPQGIEVRKINDA